ncbi:hypothetical protein J6590_099203 [Homalodisca vitripennis]|nr:hypothetical protein J6590_103485 [Homalodisca vitripennis]KAG8314140.1 hypothetical protein J6590_099203 [Homalodisca vitripennis]
MLVILEKVADTSASLTGENEKQPLAASREAALSSATYSRAVHSCIVGRVSVRARLGYREATHVRMQSERNNLTVCTRACFF